MKRGSRPRGGGRGGVIPDPGSIDEMPSFVQNELVPENCDTWADVEFAIRGGPMHGSLHVRSLLLENTCVLRYSVHVDRPKLHGQSTAVL
jgi:hypothetical protein